MVKQVKQLIVNADDFGLHTQINKGIIKGFQKGFITSTSLMCSAPAFAEAVELALANPGLGVGIHLTLVGGVAPAAAPDKVRSLLDEQGKFLPDYVAFASRFYRGGIKMSELETELCAQIERGLATGIKITHIDSHQHTHVLPIISDLVVKLCYKYNIRKIRNPHEGYFFDGGFSAGIGRKVGRAGLSFCASMAMRKAKAAGLSFPEHFFGMLAGGNLNTALVGKIIQSLPEGVSEIMTHPGLDSNILGRQFTWHYHWEDELQAFLAEENKYLLEKNDVNLTNFGGLK